MHFMQRVVTVDACVLLVLSVGVGYVLLWVGASASVPSCVHFIFLLKFLLLQIGTRWNCDAVYTTWCGATGSLVASAWLCWCLATHLLQAGRCSVTVFSVGCCLLPQIQTVLPHRRVNRTEQTVEV
jgi:hypothetical protein